MKRLYHSYCDYDTTVSVAQQILSLFSQPAAQGAYPAWQKPPTVRLSSKALRQQQWPLQSWLDCPSAADYGHAIHTLAGFCYDLQLHLQGQLANRA